MDAAMAYLVVAGIFVAIAVIALLFILGSRMASEAHDHDDGEPEK